MKRLPVVLFGGPFDGTDGHISAAEYPRSISLIGEHYVQCEGETWAYDWVPVP